MAFAIDNPGIATYEPSEYTFPLISNGVPTPLRIDPDDLPGIAIAADNLSDDFRKVCGTPATLTKSAELYSTP